MIKKHGRATGKVTTCLLWIVFVIINLEFHVKYELAAEQATVRSMVR